VNGNALPRARIPWKPGQGLRLAALTTGSALVLLGCTSRVAPENVAEVPAPVAESRPVTVPGPVATDPSGDEGSLPPEPLLSQVLADASERTGVPVKALVVASSSARTWRDGSLGCPEPGMYYTQALVSGWQLVIRAGEQTLDYRMGDRADSFMLCQPRRARDLGRFRDER
jgi:hypothetical protein